MGRCRHRLGFLVVLLAVSISVMPLLTPVSAEVSADGWAPQESGTLLTLYGVSGTSPSDVLACGDAGVILRYNGSAWISMNSGVTVPLYGIWCSSTGAAFAAGNAGTIVSYNGVSWNQMVSGTSNHLNAIWGSAADDVFAVGNVGSILHYDGISWSPMASGTTSHLRGIWGSSSTDVFTVGNGGVILHYDGISWVTMDSGTKGKLYSVWGAAPNDIVAVGEAGTIVCYDGNSWAGVGSGTTASLNGVWGTSADDIFAAGGNGLILHYDGAWSSMISGTTSILYGVWGASSSNVYVVGAGGTIIHYMESAESPPVLTSVTPVSGVCGQALVAIVSGSNLGGATVVDFGTGITVTGFQVNPDGTQITADITIDAAAAPGTRDVSVTTPAGTDSLSSAFTVQLPPPVPPIVTSVTPSSGICGQTLVAVISGSNLNGATLVEFGAGVSVTGFQISPDGTQITADITIDAAATPGTRDVSVTTPAGTDTLSSAFTVQLPPPVPPIVTSVTPSSGVCGQALVAIVSGSNLGGATLVQFGAGVSVTGFQVNPDGTQITADITIDAAATPGTRDVSLTTPAGTDTLSGAFTVELPPLVPPGLTAVTPVSGVCGQALVAVISGSNLGGATVVDFGTGVTVTGFQINPDGTQITADITIDAAATPGTRDVSVTTPAGTDSLYDTFTVLIPFSYVVETSPRSGMIGETLDIVVSGENLDGVIAVDFGPGIEVNSFTVESADRMSVRITIRQDAKAGYRDVSIVTLWSTYTQLEGFAVKAVPPSLGSISDVDGRPGEVMTVTIEGTNLVGVTQVAFGPGIEVQGFDMYPPDAIRVRIKIAEDAEPGIRDISVTTAPGGTCIFENAFEITGPSTNTPPWVPIGAATGALMAGTVLLVFRGLTTLRGLRKS